MVDIIIHNINKTPIVNQSQLSPRTQLIQIHYELSIQYL